MAKPTLQLRKIKKVFTNFLRGFWRFQQNFNCSKIVMSSEDRAIFEDLRLRGQGQGQGLEASRPRPRTSKCVLEDVLEAKDVLEDSTSASNLMYSPVNTVKKIWIKDYGRSDMRLCVLCCQCNTIILNGIHKKSVICFKACSTKSNCNCNFFRVLNW